MIDKQEDIESVKLNRAYINLGPNYLNNVAVEQYVQMEDGIIKIITKDGSVYQTHHSNVTLFRI